MNTAKQEVEALLRNLPDECTLAEIAYHVEFLRKMQEADEDFAAGRVSSHTEVKERLRKWLAPRQT
ncbi:MAG TPA: hypothetical protein VHG91_02235 [Longimicrobium sp.]|nr:hypothetical protein [Longimicrobium sp.]